MIDAIFSPSAFVRAVEKVLCTSDRVKKKFTPFYGLIFISINGGDNYPCHAKLNSNTLKLYL